MSGFKIVFDESYDDKAFYELPYRGYASHVTLYLDGCPGIPLYFIDIARLSQELDGNIQIGDDFFAENGLIVLPSVTLESIHKVVGLLVDRGFFSKGTL
jgi:hypothetical protein